MEYIKEITVDLSGEMFFHYITATQGDTARAVKITIISNNQPYTPEDGAKAILRAKKPDGNSVFNDATINADGTITAELTEQITVAAGNVRCEVSIYGADGKVLSTVPFIVKVTPASLNPGVTSSNEFGALASALAEVQEVDGVAHSALEIATEALNTIGEVEADIDAHTQAAENATERANAAAKQAEEIVEQAAGIITRYGVRFGGGSNSGSTVARLYNAVGLVAGVGTDEATADNDFDNIYPWSARRRCCGVWDADGNFIVNAYKGEPGYTEDGSNGEVWVEHSLFYYKHIYDGEAEEIAISATPLAGYAPAPIFQSNNGEGAPYQKAYTPAFPMATVDGKATSRAGVFSGIYSLNTGMNAARTLGDNYTVTTTAEWYTECLYMWVEFATRNMQGVMNGASNMPYSDAYKAIVAEENTNRVVITTAQANNFVVGQTIGVGTSLGSTGIANNRIVTAIEAYDDANSAVVFDGDPVKIAVGNIIFTLAWINGSCNGVLSSSGSPVSNTNGKYNCVYRGKETPYGNSFEWIADVLFNREGEGTEESPYTYDPYFLPDPTKYANGSITDNYVKMNYSVPSTDGYAKTLGKDDRFPWVRMPSAIGASSTTYYADYYYYPRYALCAARVGGAWGHGSGGGPCSWHCSHAPSSSGISFRARLSYHRK